MCCDAGVGVAGIGKFLAQAVHLHVERLLVLLVLVVLRLQLEVVLFGLNDVLASLLELALFILEPQGLGAELDLQVAVMRGQIPIQGLCLPQALLDHMQLMGQGVHLRLLRQVQARGHLGLQLGAFLLELSDFGVTGKFKLLIPIVLTLFLKVRLFLSIHVIRIRVLGHGYDCASPRLLLLLLLMFGHLFIIIIKHDKVNERFQGRSNQESCLLS